MAGLRDASVEKPDRSRPRLLTCRRHDGYVHPIGKRGPDLFKHDARTR